MIITEYGSNPNSIEVVHYPNGNFTEIIIGADECNSIGSESVQLTNDQFEKLVNELVKMKEKMV